MGSLSAGGVLRGVMSGGHVPEADKDDERERKMIHWLRMERWTAEKEAVSVCVSCS